MARCTPVSYKASPESRKAFERRGLPVEMLDLLEKLLHIDPRRRPGVASVLRSWALIKVGKIVHQGKQHGAHASAQKVKPNYRRETSVASSIVTQIPSPRGSANDTPLDIRKAPHLTLPPCDTGNEWKISAHKGLTKYTVAALKVSVSIGGEHMPRA